MAHGAPTNAGIADEQGVGTIVNDDPLPTISINDVTKPEGNSGATAFTFTISLSNPSADDVTLNYATTAGSAAAPSDYTSISGSLTFSPGELTKTVTVYVNGDTTVEGNETFTLDLSNVSGGSAPDASGLGTIQNDDTSVSINDVSTFEGNSGTTQLLFTLTLSNVSASAVNLDWATVNGTATTADADYVSASGSVTFAAGELVKTVTVTVNGDLNYEQDETVFVNLSNISGGSAGDGQGQGTIQNDDGQPYLTIDSASNNEGNSGTTEFVFTLTLTAENYQTITVDWATEDDTATTSNNDYTSAGGTVTFNPGDTSKTVTVNVNGDTTFEADEQFKINLSNGSNVGMPFLPAFATIVNDDSMGGGFLLLAAPLLGGSSQEPTSQNDASQNVAAVSHSAPAAASVASSAPSGADGIFEALPQNEDAEASGALPALLPALPALLIDALFATGR